MPDRQNHPAWDQIEPNVRFDPLSASDRHNRPGEHEIALSQAISLKRIADALDSSESGGRPQGSVLWWLETIASAANAGRS